MGMRTLEGLYAAHALVELVLGAVKLRGRYSGMEMPDGAEKFARHHGVALLAIALLGAETLRRGLVRTAAGTMVSLVLCAFHAGCVAVMLHAAIANRAALNVAFMHAPFAIGFGAHALNVTSSVTQSPARHKAR